MIWSDSELCAAPHYAQRVIQPLATKFLDCTALEASARAASEVSETTRDDVAAADIAI